MKMKFYMDNNMSTQYFLLIASSSKICRDCERTELVFSEKVEI